MRAVVAELRRIHPLAQVAVIGRAIPTALDISKMRCGTCGNLTPQCTCVDAEGQPLKWQ
jgi:hypothetical protein